jgi:two-component system chemotaxis response regulator CheB
VSPYKVMIVDDSAFMRAIISDLINEDPLFTVIYAAKNGKEAVDKVMELKPDIVTMDVEMPEMNGLQAVQSIMETHPTPIIMLSNLTDTGAKETILALEYGAVDFVTKPSGSISLDLYKVKQSLMEKLRIAVNTPVRHLHPIRPSGLNSTPKKKEQRNFLSNLLSNRFEHLVAIGSSTGGPRALQYIVSRLPRYFPAPIFIVQHMPARFTKTLADRLDSVSEIRVVEAEDGSPVTTGTAYIAPGDWQMKLIKQGAADYRIRLSAEEPRNGHRPSVDVLYESLLPLNELKKHLVILTGMGNDGAQGMKILKQAGAQSTIAEAEQSCVVYGMPKAAIQLNVVDQVLPLPSIPTRLFDLICT